MTLARDLALTLDPALWAEARMGHSLDAWQAAILRTIGQQNCLLNVHRQGGKSVTAGVLGLYIADTEPGSLVLFLSPTQRQSAELLYNTARLLDSGDTAISLDAQSALRLTLQNGSRIISLPGQEATVRGYAGVRLLVIDEAARVPDELYFSVRPMLAVSGGHIVAMSTPFGKRGWWHREWTAGQGWKRVKVLAEQCPRISPAFLAQERAALGDWWYEQEYECQFKDPVDSVFSHDLVQQAVTGDVLPLFPEVEP